MKSKNFHPLVRLLHPSESKFSNKFNLPEEKWNKMTSETMKEIDQNDILPIQEVLSVQRLPL